MVLLMKDIRRKALYEIGLKCLVHHFIPIFFMKRDAHFLYVFDSSSTFCADDTDDRRQSYPKHRRGVCGWMNPGRSETACRAMKSCVLTFPFSFLFDHCVAASAFDCVLAHE